MIAKNEIGTAATGYSEQAGATLFETIKQRIAKRAKAVADRFEAAKAEASLRYDTQMQYAAKCAELGKLPKVMPQERMLCGYLVSPTSGVALPLYQGSNVFAHAANSKVQAVAVGTQDGTEIQIEEDKAQVTPEGLKPYCVLSNESVSIGQHSFVIKLLPADQRIKQPVYSI